MMFVSYAQNFEDVMLWRALKQIEKGFYIDVGAWSPEADSVTKAFYEKGWCGINIEPHPEYFKQLKKKRPRDINLSLAVGDHCGKITINFHEKHGLSTADNAFALKHRQDGWKLEKSEVQLATLSHIFEQYVPKNQDVHFLKVDVEGLEENVIRGSDWKRIRPWIVVVEATIPMTQIESHDSWEPILLSAGYYFAYMDGLNRFYVASEHLDLLLAFKYPPNVFDEFILYDHQVALTRIAQLELFEKQLKLAESSYSCRITFLLRWGRSMLKRVMGSRSGDRL